MARCLQVGSTTGRSARPDERSEKRQRYNCCCGVWGHECRAFARETAQFLPDLSLGRGNAMNGYYM